MLNKRIPGFNGVVEAMVPGWIRLMMMLSSLFRRATVIPVFAPGPALRKHPVTTLSDVESLIRVVGMFLLTGHMVVGGCLGGYSLARDFLYADSIVVAFEIVSSIKILMILTFYRKLAS